MLSSRSYSFLLVLLVSCSVHAGEPTFDRYREFHAWSAGESGLLTDLRDRRLDHHTVVDAALVAAGHSEQIGQRCKQVISASIARCHSKLRSEQTKREKLRQIFRHIADDFLKGRYQSDLFDLKKTIDGGEFNCLTATILFTAFCDDFSLDAEAIWEPSHVQVWVPASDKYGFSVETTAQSAFDAVSELQYFRNVHMRSLDRNQLLGKVFYNKGVWALKSEQYPSALGATWLSTLLDSQDVPAQNNLRACFNNWALAAVAKDSNYELAGRLLDAGIALDPSYEPFLRNKSLLMDR